MSLVYLKNKKNGVTYVYDSTGYWDKDKQQARNRRKCIGKIDPVTGALVPSKRLADAEASLPSKPGPVPTVECKRLFYGATHLFDAIGEKLGITDDLKRCFPESYNNILSIAYYSGYGRSKPYESFYKVGKDACASVRQRYPLAKKQ